MIPKRLTPKTFRTALGYLSETDKDLKTIIESYGSPPMWIRDPGFPTLVHIILEQQVSLASAKAAFDKLNQVVSELLPKEFLLLDDQELKKIGFSRQKTNYCRYLAESIDSGSLQLDKLENKSDTEIRTELQKIKGIGSWTADIYLLMAMGRPDIWPQGDLALISAISHVKKLPSKPSDDDFKNLGKAWKPWRAVAARILWHYYLSNKTAG